MLTDLFILRKRKEKGETYFREGTFVLLLLAESCQVSLLLVHYIFIGLKDGDARYDTLGAI